MRYGRRRAGNAAGCHKTANVLNKLPKSLQAKAKRVLQDVWMAAPTRTYTEAAFDGFIECYGVKYDKAVECLSKDGEPLLRLLLPCPRALEDV